MRYIDAFCHFFPPRLFEQMSRTAGGTKDIGKRIQGVRTIYDLEARLKMMDEFGDYAEILSLGLPPLDAMAGPQAAAEFARIANDGLAELCAKHPDRFAGYVGALPMNAPEAAAKEAERILIRGNANGLQLHTNVDGACLDEPRFFPIFEVAAKSGKPVLLHPARTPPPRGAAFLPNLRGRRQVGQASPAAPGAHAQRPGLPGRDQIEIRDLG